MSRPVSFDLERPETFQRAHVFLRVALLIVIGWIAHPIGLLWLGLPVVAAILISLDGGRRYLDEHGPTVTFVLGWILAAVAYLALLTDRLPGRGERPVRFQVEPSGSPTVGSALLRILYAIPSIIVLALLVFAARSPGCSPPCSSTAIPRSRSRPVPCLERRIRARSRRWGQ